MLTTVDPLGHLEHKSCLQCGVRDADASLQRQVVQEPNAS